MNKTTYRYRVFFTKTDSVRFIGHLDLQSLFQRAFKRTSLPVAYSEGFNPHQILSFAAPLPLGTAGLAEILEIYMTHQIEASSIAEALNPQMPDGINIQNAYEIPATGKGAAAHMIAATYSITFPHSTALAENIERIIFRILNDENVMIEKKTKKGRSMTDIRPDILDLQRIDCEGKISIKAKLSTGSSRNLKPELLVEYIAETTVDIIVDEPVYVREQLHLAEVKP